MQAEGKRRPLCPPPGEHLWLDGGTSSSKWLVCLNCGRDAQQARQEEWMRRYRRWNDSTTNGSY